MPFFVLESLSCIPFEILVILQSVVGKETKAEGAGSYDDDRYRDLAVRISTNQFVSLNPGVISEIACDGQHG